MVVTGFQYGSETDGEKENIGPRHIDTGWRDLFLYLTSPGDGAKLRLEKTEPLDD